MAKITLKGKPFETVGELPRVGQQAPEFELVNSDLATVKLSDFRGKKVVLSLFPSVDTPVCATGVRSFNQEAASVENSVVLCISCDLPFAHKRFCAAEEIENVVTLSAFRNPEFGRSYGITIKDGPLAGLFSRAVVVVGEDGNILHTEQVVEIADEPDYKKAIEALS